MSESGSPMSELGFKSTLPEQEKLSFQGTEKPIAKEQISGVLKSSAEMHALTNAIEESVETDAVRNKIDEKIRKGGLISKFADHINLTNALAVGIIASGISIADIFADERSVESQLTTDQKQTVETVTGMPFSELSKKFDIQLPGVAGKNKYIIHFGQSHEHPIASQRAATQSIIIEHQKLIEDVALSTVKVNKLPCIFAEGVSKEETMLHIRNTINSANEALDPLMEKPIQSFQNLEATYDLISQYNTNHPHIYHYLGPKIASLEGRIIEALKTGKVKPRGTREEEKIKMIETDLYDSELSKALATGEKPNPYTVGIEFKALMDKKVKYLCAAEDSDLNKRAFAAMVKKQQIELEYSKKRNEVFTEMSKSRREYPVVKNIISALWNKVVENLTNTERKKLDAATRILEGLSEAVENDPRLKEVRQRLKEAEAQNHMFRTLREKEVLRRINQFDQKTHAEGGQPGHIVLMYGKNHDIAPELQEWNARNSPNAIDRGLIKISPKE